RLEPMLSARPAARLVSARLARAAAETPATPMRLVAYDHYLHGIPFYTGRQVDVVDWLGELAYAKRFARFQDRFGDDATIAGWPRPGERVLVITPVGRLPWLEKIRGGPESVKDVETAGTVAVAELVRAPSAPPSSSGGRAPGRAAGTRRRRPG
ncbi:MAG: hypothetical protein KGL53_04485, partial [Elusimicrobia bacterium]|nr:hypothetical protein [Elusimicrobiota bacterium]